MKKQVYKKSLLNSLLLGVAPFLFTGVVIVALLFGFAQADEASRAEGARLLEESLRRVAIHSYAVNGRFPPSLEYITKNYDIYINNSRFMVHYSVFASNIMPTIIVFQMD